MNREDARQLAPTASPPTLCTTGVHVVDSLSPSVTSIYSNNSDLNSVENDCDLSVFRDRMRNQSTLKQKVRKFAVTLHKNDTLWYAILTKALKMQSVPFHSFSKKLLISLAVFFFILVLIDYTLNNYFWRSIEFNIILKVPALLCIIMFTLNCNYFIFKQSLQSFVVWYKTVFSIIAAICRSIYYDFFVEYWSNGKYNNLQSAQRSTNGEYLVQLCVVSNVLSIVCVGLGVFTLALLDGYATKGNTIKRVFMVIGIFICLILYLELYFNIYHYDEDKSWDVEINGGSGGSTVNVYWRDIGLSSLFKAIVFFLAQFYHNIRHPKKLNVVPLPAIIEYVHATTTNKNGSHDANNNNNDSATDDNNNNQGNETQKSGSMLALAIVASNSKNNKNKNNKKHSTEIATSISSADNNSCTNAQQIQSIEPSESRDVENMRDINDNVAIDDDKKSGQIDNKNGTETADGEQVQNGTGFDNEIFSNKDGRGVSISVNSFVLTVPVEYTLIFVILNKKCFKLTPAQAFEWSQRIFNIRFQVFCALIVMIGSILRYVLRDINNDYTLIVIDCCMLLGFTIAVLNLNFKIVKFRMFSVVSLWKVFNVMTMWMAIYTLEYEFRRGEFDKNQYSLGVSFSDAIMMEFAWCLGALIVNLVQGYYIHKGIKLSMIGLIILWNMRRAIYHYFNAEYDHNVHFLGRNVSLRTLIFVKGLDVSIWFTVQFWQILRNPNKLNLVSKVRVKWID